MHVAPIEIRWNPELPVFAKEEFLRAVGDEYGWLGGFDEPGSLRCFLPYTIIRKGTLRLVRFRVETIPCAGGLAVEEERAFLNGVVDHFRRQRADIIIPGANNAIFRTYPDGADAAPYGTYVIDLRQPEEVIWRRVDRITRQNITTAQRDGVSIREGLEFLEPAYDLVRETFSRSKMGFMSRASFIRFAEGLGEQGRLFAAHYKGEPQSYCLFGFSTHSAYAIYAGNVSRQHQGSNKLLYWEAARRFRELGVAALDFAGARIRADKGSKQDGINAFKRRLGAGLIQGYMWKLALRPWRASVYAVGVRLLRGGDIVDQERHKLKDYAPALSGALTIHDSASAKPLAG
ncbi:MAG TPA: GNAT family N-acetyltransferase [Vicinamibacterales bacterium]|nr:GNAT family N-acetyltransferase [Vicinamibacterales bacterium]